MDEPTVQTNDGPAYAAGQDRGRLVGAATAAQPSYLEQLAQELARYRELLNILDEKLGVVSERSPSPPSDNIAKEPRVHISTMVHIMQRNNGDLDRIISEIAL